MVSNDVAKLLFIFCLNWILTLSVGSVVFELYECQRSLLDNDNCTSSGTTDDVISLADLHSPHAVIKVDDLCYDWTKDDNINTAICTNKHFNCCLEKGRSVSQAETYCADKIPTFLKFWNIIGFRYSLWGFNGQRFAGVLKQFLVTC